MNYTTQHTAARASQALPPVQWVAPQGFAAALRARAEELDREQEAQAQEHAASNKLEAIYEQRLREYEAAASAAVEGVLSAHLSPRALASLRQFCSDLDQGSDYVGLSLADCLDALFGERDGAACKVLAKTLRRLQREA